jgi:hypothetical protein
MSRVFDGYGKNYKKAPIPPKVGAVRGSIERCSVSPGNVYLAIQSNEGERQARATYSFDFEREVGLRE